MDKNNSLEKYNHSLIRVSKQIAITNKLLKKISEIVTDIDGNIYHTVKIGTQVWMVENLNVNHFRNGEIIPEVRNAKEWEEAGKSKQPAWCYYDNNPENGKTYGKLYNWYAIYDNRNIAHKGWHVPNDKEWKILVDYENIFSFNEGTKFKEIGNLHWLRSNFDATNESGFTGLPGGYRLSCGIFNGIGENAHWGCSTEVDHTHSLYYGLHCDITYVHRDKRSKNEGFSVRCIKDY